MIDLIVPPSARRSSSTPKCFHFGVLERGIHSPRNCENSLNYYLNNYHLKAPVQSPSLPPMGPFNSKPPKKVSPPITSQDKAVLDLKNSRDRLKKYTKRLESDQVRLVERAKVFLREGDKRNAVFLMKVKKKKESEVANVEGQLLRVYDLVSAIEWEAQQGAVVEAMRAGKDAMREMHEEMSVDAVLELMDEIQDQDEVARRINEALSKGIGGGEVDEEEVEREMRVMEREMGLGEGEGEELEELEMPEAPKGTPAEMRLPAAPTGSPSAAAEEEEEEGRERVAVAA